MTAKRSQDRWTPLKDINSWWFGYGSPVTLGVLRILMGLMALEELLIGLLDFQAWYTDKGFLPLQIVSDYWLRLPATFQFGAGAKGVPITYKMPLIETVPRINLFSYAFDWRVSLAIYLAIMVAAVFTTLGLWTRVSSIGLALGIISVHHRNPLILHSGDTLLRLVIIYLAFAPCGAACSLDRLIGLWKGTAPKEPRRISLWPQRLIQYQVALVYFITVWYKWFGPAWKNGTATWFPENLNEFYRFPIPDFTHRQPFLAIATYGTIVVELSLATLVFHKPIRKYVLLAGLAMHGYIEYRFNIPLFATVIVSTYVAFYDGEEISSWAKAVGQKLTKFQIDVCLPAGYGLRSGAKAMLAAADPFGLVSYSTGTNASWGARDRRDRKRRPFGCAWVRSVGVWPLGLVPGLWRRLLINSSVADCAREPDEEAEEPTIRR